MQISKALKNNAICDDLTATTRDDILEELASLIVDKANQKELQKLIDVLKAREELGSTGIGGGIAIPHGKLKDLEEIKIAFGRSKSGVDFNAIDGKQVDLFFLLLAPENSAGEHLKTLAKVSRLLKNPKFCKALREAKDCQEIYETICAEDALF